MGRALSRAKDNDKEDSNHTISNFLVTSTFFDNGWHTSGNNTIGIRFVLSHDMTPYFFKYYVPSIAIVTISMMGFTMPLTALPERVALLVTQFLTLTELFIHEMVRVCLKYCVIINILIKKMQIKLTIQKPQNNS